MKKTQKIWGLLVLCLVVLLNLFPGGPARAAVTTQIGCFSSSGTWTNQAISAQTGIFSATFTVNPSNTILDGVFGFSNGTAAAYTALAAAVRFSDVGVIDARNGAAYQAAASIPYQSGQTYTVRMVVNVTARTYSAYVTPPGGAEQLIGLNYAFRTEQAAVTQLNNFGTVVDPGGVGQVCNFAVVLPATATPSPTPNGCFSSSGVWTNQAIATQTGVFSATFTVNPSNTILDGVLGFSNGIADAYTDLAAAVRFNDLGAIDARNGAGYQAAASIPYQTGQIYTVRMVINVAARTYSAYVTPAGGSEQLIGSNYAFRTEQAAVAQLNNFATVVDPGGVAQLCNFSISLPPTATPTATRTSTPTPAPTFTPSATPTSGATCTVNVSTVSALRSAVSGARPGHVICLAAGTYSLGGSALQVLASGVPNNRITLTGPRTAILDGGTLTGGGGVIYMDNADYWTISGITLRNGKKGIMMDFGVENIIDGVLIESIGEEAIHLRKHSKYNLIQNSIVRDTGKTTPDYGEAFYVGSDLGKWNDAYFDPGEVPNADYSDYNKIINNYCGPNVRAECVDVKEGTSYGLVSGNTFDASGLTNANSANSWMDMKGNYWVISNNKGVNPSGVVSPNFVDGFQANPKQHSTRTDLGTWGNYNTFSNNTLDVRSSGYGFNIHSGTTGNKVCNNNTVTNAGSGYANVAAVSCSTAGASPVYPADLTGLESLTTWKIALPVSFDNPPDSNHAGEIKQPALDTYQLSPYFLLNTAKTGALFRAIAGGARTSTGTAYARSELRQMKGSVSSPLNADWNCSGVTTNMYLQQALLHTTTHKPEATIAQIHDSSNDNLMVKYFGPTGANGVTDTGTIQVAFNNDSVQEVLDASYKLGDPMSLKVAVVNGVMKVTYQNLRTNSWAISSAVSMTGVNGGCYFKAGMYIQACSITDIYGNQNTTCKNKGWSADKYETDPYAYSELLITRLFLANPQK